MRVAICDDEPAFRDELRALLRQYAADTRISMDIYEYPDGSSLLQAREVFDIVFMDYKMPGMNGLQTAHTLRRHNCICSIFFITSYPQFMIDSFDVSPFRFFIKPIDHDKLLSALDAYVKLQKQLNPIIIIQDGEQKTIRSETILYLEGDGKRCLIRTSNELFRSSKTLAKVLEALPGHCFYRIHKSYAVNLYFIQAVSGRHITLINGEKAVISRTHVSEFRNVYRNFVKNYYITL